MDLLHVPLALLAGSLLAVQAGANAQLARAVGSPFAATLLQLSVGSAVLLAVTLATGTLAALHALPRAEWWHAVGGIASAFYVVSTILLFPRLGAVVSVGLFIAGQMLASLALDAFGLLGLTATGLEPGPSLGTLAVLAGAALIVLGQGSGTEGRARDPTGLDRARAARGRGAARPGRGQRAAQPRSRRRDLRGRHRLLRRRDARHGRDPAAGARLAGRAPASARRRSRHAVVGLARRLCRRDLRHDRLHRDPGDRRGRRDRPHRPRPAGRERVRRPLRLVPAPAPASLAAAPACPAWSSSSPASP